MKYLATLLGSLFVISSVHAEEMPIYGELVAPNGMVISANVEQVTVASGSDYSCIMKVESKPYERRMSSGAVLQVVDGYESGPIKYMPALKKNASEEILNILKQYMGADIPPELIHAVRDIEKAESIEEAMQLANDLVRVVNEFGAGGDSVGSYITSALFAGGTNNFKVVSKFSKKVYEIECSNKDFIMLSIEETLLLFLSNENNDLNPLRFSTEL